MKKKISLNKKLSLNKAVIGSLNSEGPIMDAQQADARAGRLTTIGRTCIPWSFGEWCLAGTV